MYKNLNNIRTVGLILTKLGTVHQLHTIQTVEGSITLFFKIHDGRRRKNEIYQKMNNFRTVDPIVAKFGRELQLDTVQTVEWSKITFFKIQDGRRRKH